MRSLSKALQSGRQEVVFLLKKYGLKENLRLGQHFMVDHGVLETIVQTSGVTKKDIVVEIGPGLGFLTKELLPKAQEVHTIEIDQQFLPLLHDLQRKNPTLTVLHQDALRVNYAVITQGRPFHVVSNLPYQITSRFLRIMLEQVAQQGLILSQTLVVQKEVAQRMLARPGEMSLLSLLTQIYSDAELIQTIPSSAFWPEPEVESALVHIVPKNFSPVEHEEIIKLFHVARVGFSARRKKLITNLVNGHISDRERLQKIFADFGWSENRRAQELSIPEWRALVQVVETRK